MQQLHRDLLALSQTRSQQQTTDAVLKQNAHIRQQAAELRKRNAIESKKLALMYKQDRARAVEARRVAELPKCPECFSPLEGLPKKCFNCQVDLDWVVLEKRDETIELERLLSETDYVPQSEYDDIRFPFVIGGRSSLLPHLAALKIDYENSQNRISEYIAHVELELRELESSKTSFDNKIAKEESRPVFQAMLSRLRAEPTESSIEYKQVVQGIQAKRSYITACRNWITLHQQHARLCHEQIEMECMNAIDDPDEYFSISDKSELENFYPRFNLLLSFAEEVGIEVDSDRMFHNLTRNLIFPIGTGNKVVDFLNKKIRWCQTLPEESMGQERIYSMKLEGTFELYGPEVGGRLTPIFSELKVTVRVYCRGEAIEVPGIIYIEDPEEWISPCEQAKVIIETTQPVETYFGHYLMAVVEGRSIGGLMVSGPRATHVDVIIASIFPKCEVSEVASALATITGQADEKKIVRLLGKLPRRIFKNVVREKAMKIEKLLGEFADVDLRPSEKAVQR